MSLDIGKLVRDYRLPIAGPGDKHHRQDWINLPCPFCLGGGGFHLGYNIQRGYWNCYRCGWHNDVEVIREILDVSWTEAKAIRVRYGGRPILRAQIDPERPSRVTLPPGTGELGKQHKRYLRERGFNPRILEEEWNLFGTGPTGPYKFRIIAPIFFKGKIVSYLGRDITGKSQIRYKACPLAEEIINHKTTLYGLDKAKGRHSVIVVEGITDVWRLGPGTMATFGQEWSMPQVKLLKDFPRRFILFDSEPEAQRQARLLAGALAGFPGITEIVDLGEGDPGALSDQEARELVKTLSGAL